MRRQSIFFVLVWVMIGFWSCTPKETFKLNLQQGMDYHLKTVTKFEGEQTLMGQKQVSNSDLIQNIKFHVQKVENQHFVGQLTFPKMKLNVNLGVGVLTIDGDEPDENPLSHVFSAMKTHGLEISIDPMGSVLFLQSMDDYFDQILNEMQEGALSLEDKIELKTQLLEQFNEASIRSQLESFTRIPPNETVKEGSTWKLTYEQLTPVGGTLKNKYEIVEEGTTTWTVNFEGTLNPDKKAHAVKVQGYETKFKMTGSYTGHIILDKVSAWPVEGKIEHAYKGDLLMMVNDKETKVPAMIHAETILTP